MSRRTRGLRARAARLLLRAAGVLLAAVAAFVIVSAMQSSTASAAATPGDGDNSSLFGLAETVAAPVVEAAAPEVVEPVAAPVVAVAAPIVQPVVAAAVPVVEVVEPVAAPVVAVAAPIVQPVVAAAVPVVEVVEPVVAAAAPVVEVVEPVAVPVAAAPAVEVVEPLAQNVTTAVASAVARVNIVADRIVGSLQLLDAFDAVAGELDQPADLMPGAPPVSKVVGTPPNELVPLIASPVVADPIDGAQSPTRSSQPEPSSTGREVVTFGPSSTNPPDRDVGTLTPVRGVVLPAPSDLWSAVLADLPPVGGTLVGGAAVAPPSVEFDSRSGEKSAGGPFAYQALAVPPGGAQVPAASSSGSGGDPLARSHAVVPSSAYGVNWLSRGITTDVSWTSALFVLSIECPG